MAKRRPLPIVKRQSFPLIRICQADIDRLKKHLLADPSCEQFAFALCTPMSTSNGLVLLVRSLLLPDAQDLEVQTANRVSPTAACQAMVYAAAESGGHSLIDFHTHTNKQLAALSSFDQEHAELNARYIANRFSPSVTHAWVVFNNDLSSFDGQVYDRVSASRVRIREIQVVGRASNVHFVGCGEFGWSEEEDLGTHVRQVLVPGWNQWALTGQRVAIVGAGGNGANLFATLAALGVGEEGWVSIIDPDRVEPPDVSRSPYAVLGDIGQAKVTVATDFARRKDPHIVVFPFPCSAKDPAVEQCVRACTVLFGAGDNDGVRKICNEWSIRFGIPYIDLGCDIQVYGTEVVAGGQVRVVVPGQTACLVCTHAFDPAAAALDLLDAASAQRRAATGYVVGADVAATPSVASLNALTAQLGVMALLSLVGCRPFSAWDYAHLDFLTGKTLTASSRPSASCPLCGPDGVLFAGPARTQDRPDSEPAWTPMSQPVAR